ncbi:flagellar hook-basal body complex protein FliE [Celeribacter naphthalenivorans]|uniref:flagellar hook-basal body complex protein FliE n=1 Tax=Celeribacter naphthalenivorans TaxID=1614694 RepID=UPI001CF9504A|nr:flagellar hook-basal body complex protein FliE [Celeribacter naphthalenivorans]
MDIRSAFAAQGYAATRPATAAQPKTNEQAGQNPLGKAAASFAETLAQGEEVAQATMAGKADSQALVQALAQSEMAIEAAVTVRDKVVEAYQEILRMPV